jgi:hypothetical protein
VLTLRTLVGVALTMIGRRPYPGTHRLQPPFSNAWRHRHAAVEAAAHVNPAEVVVLITLYTAINCASASQVSVSEPPKVDCNVRKPKAAGDHQSFGDWQTW